MSSQSYQILAGPIIPEEIWAEGLGIAFSWAGKAMEGKCGVVVLYSEEDQSFVEVAGFGYGEEGHYYDFLARGAGNFEKVSVSEVPLIFSKSKGYRFYHLESEYCIVVRIFQEKMLGFLLMEFGSGIRLELNSWVLGLIASRIGYLKDKPIEKEREGSSSTANQGGYDFAEEILSQVEDWEMALEKIKQKHHLTLTVESGKVRNRIVKYIHQRLGQVGELLFINILPEQIGKLEKALEEWVRIGKWGTLVFESISTINIAQQRILFEFVREHGTEVAFLFCEIGDLDVPTGYSPFQKLVKENLLVIPKLSLLKPEKRLSIFRGLIKEVCNLYSRRNIMVAVEALDFLEEKSAQVNLEEIQNILESSILKCRDSSLTKRHLEEEWGSREKSASQHDPEDLDLRKSVEAIERQKILLAMKLFSGNQMRMAKALGISRGSLQYKMKQMGLS